MAEHLSQERHTPGTQSNASPPGNPLKDENMNDISSTKEPSRLKKIWTRLGLNPGMFIMMTKMALPPTISLAIYESSSVAAYYSTQGYLIAIMSVLSFAIMPRARFIQTMLLNVIGVCIGAAVGLLQIYCSIKARQHTTKKPSSSSHGPSPGAALSQYNSSAAAVCATWLFFNIYIVNLLRASRPQLQFPAIIYSIFANVTSVYAPSFPTMDAGISFAKRLLVTFLTGFAIATGVSLLVVPISVRISFFGQSAGFIQGIRGILKAQMSYLQSLEKPDMFAVPKDNKTGVKTGKHYSHESEYGPKSATELATEKLRAAILGLEGIYGKLNADLAFAKREMAWGKLDASDISALFRLLQGLMLPLTGMSSTADIFQRLAAEFGWSEVQDESANPEKFKDALGLEVKGRWNEIMTTLHEPFKEMTDAMDAGLQHSLYVLELEKRPKKERKSIEPDSAAEDVEAKAGIIRPGDEGCARHLEKRIEEFYEKRKLTVTAYAHQRGIKLDVTSLDDLSKMADQIRNETSNDDDETQQRNKRQLFLVLYMEFLLWSTGKAVLDLVQFADKKVEEGTMKKKRLITPGGKRLKKWLKNLLKGEDDSTENTPDVSESGGAGVYSGASFQKAKDPEHLPPANAWQHFGSGIRSVGETLGSDASVFGFRVACATLSIGIVAFLGDSREFFLQQRLVWAMIMISISMTITAGSGVFGFMGRIAGTFIAMCTSFIIWYIVDGKIPGVIVFIFIFIFIETYFILAYPRFVIITLLSIVTQILIIGYEEEVKKVGVKVATSNGQPYYHIYLLAPYRLACVSGGMVVAFIWTFFPYPLTARSQLRKDLGESLYLLANFYSITHTTVGLRINDLEGDMESKRSPGRKLEKARREVYGKCLTLFAGLRQHSAFTAWEPTFGGKFPKQQYDLIIEKANSILNYMMLISYASKSLSRIPSQSPEQSKWIEDFARLVHSISATSQEVTSILALLSASIINGNALPPYLKAPKPYNLTRRLEELDADILSISHVAEPGYSAFAVMQIASSLVSDDLQKLIENVKELVGEVDFAFHVISTADSSEETLLNKGKVE